MVLSFAGTSQAYNNLTLPTTTIGAGSQQAPRIDTVDNPALSRDRSHDIQTGSHDIQTGSRDLHHYAHSESDVSSYSDNFPTMYSATEHVSTSDVAASYPPNISHAAVINEQRADHHPPPDVADGYATEHAQHASHTYQDSHTPSQVTHPTPSQVTHPTPFTSNPPPGRMEQLQILYDARGRRINQLTQQLSATTDDSEIHIRILRHEKVCTRKQLVG